MVYRRFKENWVGFLKEGINMKMKFTPEEVTEFGKEFGEILPQCPLGYFSF